MQPVLTALLVALAAAADPIVSTPCGTYAGTTRVVDGVAGDADLGIRFAEAPVGQRRWRPPTPPACDPGAVFTAVTQMPACVQDLESPVMASDEDCLFMNVASTSGLNASSRAPVLVHFHGARG